MIDETAVRAEWREFVEKTYQCGGERYLRMIGNRFATIIPELDRMVEEYAEYEEYAKEHLLIHEPLEAKNDHLASTKMLCEEIDRAKKMHGLA